MQRRFGAASIAVTVKGWHILLKGIGMLPMASSRAQRDCVYLGWTRGPAVVDSSVGYIADSQGPVLVPAE
jgi:hypothetical protein